MWAKGPDERVSHLQKSLPDLQNSLTSPREGFLVLVCWASNGTDTKLLHEACACDFCVDGANRFCIGSGFQISSCCNGRCRIRAQRVVVAEFVETHEVLQLSQRLNGTSVTPKDLSTGGELVAPLWPLAFHNGRIPRLVVDIEVKWNIVRWPIIPNKCLRLICSCIVAGELLGDPQQTL